MWRLVGIVATYCPPSMRRRLNSMPKRRYSRNSTSGKLGAVHVDVFLIALIDFNRHCAKSIKRDDVA